MPAISELSTAIQALDDIEGSANAQRQGQRGGTAARDSSNGNDFALVAILGLLGLRVSEACGDDVSEPKESSD